jgi:hypothetical protein
VARRIWLTVSIVALAAGCGHEHASSGARLPLPPSPTVTVTGPVDGSAPLTAAGRRLRMGGPAVVAYRALAFTHDATKLEVRVTAVEKGSLDDLKAAGVELGEGTQGHTPWYVRTQFINRGPGDITDSTVSLSSGIMLLDSAEKPQEPGAWTGLGRFNTCESDDGLYPSPWRPGRTATDCTVFLLPDGTTPTGVTFPAKHQDHDSPSLAKRVIWRM